MKNINYRTIKKSAWIKKPAPSWNLAQTPKWPAVFWFQISTVLDLFLRNMSPSKIQLLCVHMYTVYLFTHIRLRRELVLGINYSRN